VVVTWRFLIDENLEPDLVTLLRRESIDAEHVQETVGKGTDDTAIAEYALENDLIIVTNNVSDFAHQPSEDHAGLALVYDDTRPPSALATAIKAMVETYDEYGGTDAFHHDRVDDYP